MLERNNVRNLYFIFFLILGLPIGCAPAQVANEPSISKGEEFFGRALCSAKDVILMPGGDNFILRDQTIFPRTQAAISYQGWVYYLTWPNRVSIPVAETLGSNLTSVLPISTSDIVSATSQNEVLLHRRTGKSNFSETKLEVDTRNLGFNSSTLVSGPNGFVANFALSESISSNLGTDAAKDKILESENGVLDTDKRFHASNTDDGLVARLIFEGKLYWLGSKDGRNLALKKPDGEVIVLDPRLDRYSFPDLTLARTNTGGIAIVAQGLHIDVNNDGTVMNRQVDLYSRVVFDSTDGNIVGQFSPNKFESISGQHSDLIERTQAEIANWTSRGWVLRGVATDRDVGKAALLFKTISGRFNTYPRDSSSLVLIGKKNVQRWQCVQTESQQLAPSSTWHAGSVRQQARRIEEVPDAKLKLSFEELRSADGRRRIGKWTIRPPFEKGVLVQLRGGPATNLYDQQLTNFDKAALASGWKIIRYDYSGSTNTSLEVYSGLFLNVRQALEQDSEMISTDLAQESFSLPIVLHATSFGARLAPLVKERLSTRIAGMLMQVPFAFWRPANEATDFEQWSASEISQSQFDYATFGAPINSNGLNFNQWSQTITEKMCGSPNVFYYFGQRDKRVRLEDWTNVCGTDLVAKIYPNVGHGIIDKPEFVQDASLALASIVEEFNKSK